MAKVPHKFDEYIDTASKNVFEYKNIHKNIYAN